jgi:maoC domain protein dehydratase
MQKVIVGDEASVSKTISETDVYNFAGICGDFNPIRVNKESAKGSRFGDRICHGMLVASFISTVIGMYLPGEGAIYLEQNIRFVAPVYIGDTITATVKVNDVKGNVVVLETNVKNQSGKNVINGMAKVLI